MGDRDVTEVEGLLTKVYSELDEINAHEKKKLEELDKMTALHSAKLEEMRALSGRLVHLREQQIARLQSEIYVMRDTRGYAVGNERPDERIIEEDRGGAVAICGADAGNGDEDMEDHNQDGNADEDEDDEDEDYDDEDDEDYDPEYDENEEDSEDEDDEDEEDAECEDEDDEHGDEDGVKLLKMILKAGLLALMMVEVSNPLMMTTAAQPIQMLIGGAVLSPITILGSLVCLYLVM